MTRAASWLVTRLGVILVPAWIVAAALAVHYLPAIDQSGGDALGGLIPKKSQAVDTQLREARVFGNTLLTRVVVVQRDPRNTVQVAQQAAKGRFPFLKLAVPLISANKKSAVTYLYFSQKASNVQALAIAKRYARALDPPGLRTGPLVAREAEFQQIRRSLPWVTLATVVLIVLVLLLTFRAIVPPLLVLGTAGIAYVISTRVLAWVGEQRHQTVPKEVEPILVALLLGLVTDYSIFFLHGMRRRLAEPGGRLAAADGTTRENLPIIVTAGLIVALGSLSLVAGHLEVFRAFGPGMALTVVIALAVATTFLPGVLALLGPAAFWPTGDRPQREPRVRLWRLLTARPVSALLALAVVALLLVGAAGMANLRLGFTLVRGQSQSSEVKRAQQWAERGFPAGVTSPTEALVRGDPRPAMRAARATPGVSFVTPAQRRNGTARFLVVLRNEALDAHAIDALRRVRARAPDGVAFAGDTAIAEETVTSIRNDAVRVSIVVLLVNLVLLALFLRAVLAPLYLLAASVLAVGAALGVTTWIMQGALAHDDVTYYVPFAASVLLLSLGSDYNVFVVGRIWQAARERPMREAIADVAPRTSSAITTAGITLAGSFGLLALIPLRPMRELALAMAVGIVLDTFVVRSLLVPSLLALFRSREKGRTEPLADGERPLHE